MPNPDEHGNIVLKRVNILLSRIGSASTDHISLDDAKEKEGTMKVKTGIKAGGLLNETADQAKQAVLTTTGYVQDLRQGVLDAAQSGLEKARQTWNAVVTV